MNATSLFTIAALSFAATTLIAAEPEATTEDAKTTVEPYHLKKRSVCNIAPEVRPPFWPIGWVHHEGPHQEPVGPKYVLDEKNFAVTSILMGPPAIAFINGRAYEEGQFLRMTKASALVAAPTAPTAPAAPTAASSTAAPRIRVQRITDGQVWLAFETQIIAVSLKRPELNGRKVDQELLNEDKEDAAPALPAKPAVSKN